MSAQIISFPTKAAPDRSGEEQFLEKVRAADGLLSRFSDEKLRAMYQKLAPMTVMLIAARERAKS